MEKESMRFYHQCENKEIVKTVFFDLFFVSKGEESIVKPIKSTLDEFAEMIGLHANAESH